MPEADETEFDEVMLEKAKNILEYLKSISSDPEKLALLADDEFRSKMAKLFLAPIVESVKTSQINPDKLFELRSILSSESDRGCVLMAAAYLDEELGNLIRAFLVDDKKVVDELFSEKGPSGTFSSRINMAYSLGLISQISTRDLHLIRKIRNEFAHISLKLSFNSENIASRCKELTGDQYPRNHDPRRKFIRATMSITAHIHSYLAVLSHSSPRANPDYQQVKDFYQNLLSLEENMKFDE